MGRRAVVAVTGSSKGSRTAWLFSRFLLRRAGLEPRFVHPGGAEASTKAAEEMRGLLILGGVDIDPATYEGTEHPSIVRSEPERDALELSLLERARTKGLPAMGICRGMQLINLFHGGTLHPHIHDLELQNAHPHSPLPVRDVTVEAGTRLHAIVGTPKLRVNALHHQAVERLGEGLRSAAHDANGIVQALEGTGERFLLGVQWHPEYMPYAWHSGKIFAAFAAAVKEGRA